MLPFLIVLTLAWGALAFGSVYPWAYVPLGAAAVLIGAIALRRRPAAGAPLERPLVGALVAVGISVALQLLPLPHAVLAAISPRTDLLLRKQELGYALQLATTGPSHAWHALSVVPPATLLGLGLFVPFAVLFAGLARGLTARESRAIAGAIAGVGLVLSLVALLQRAGGNGRIYGVWLPEGGLVDAAHPGGPFINRNHFAGWMLMAVPLALGGFAAVLARTLPGAGHGWRQRLLWFASREANQAMLVAASILTMGLALVASLSRSGIACFVIAIGATGWVVLRTAAGEREGRPDRPTGPGHRGAVLAAYLALLVLLSFGWAGIDSVAARFARIPGADAADRWSAWADTVRIIRDFPFFGTGIGTYGDVMLFYQSTNPLDRLAQAHNDYLQVLAEGGLLVGIPALVFLALFVREVRRRFRDDTREASIYWIRVGAVTGLIAIALQELVEFSLQCPGNTALFVVLMAIAAGKLPHRQQSRESVGRGV